MKRLSLALVVICAATAVAVAAGDPIKERQTLMKGNGDALKSVMGMLKGEKPYCERRSENVHKRRNGESSGDELAWRVGDTGPSTTFLPGVVPEFG